MEYGNSDVNHLVWKSVENRYHHNEDGLTLDNQNVNISILGREIEDNSVILDVGCGEGKFAKLLKNKNCRIYGIEIDKAAGEAAREDGNYVDLFNVNIENINYNIDEYKRMLKTNILFDYIAIIDVLEHTINPTKVLLELSKLLKKNGKILISVPNINNADIVLNLLRGKFNYMEAGILDNTHTKYFTKTSFVEWIDEINHCTDFKFECKYLGGVYGLTSYLENLMMEMPRVFEFIQLNPEFNIIQNLFMLSKKENTEELKEINEQLRENKPDLVKILSDYLEHGMNNKYVEQISEIKMLPNERIIMSEKALSAEIGWKECESKLNEIEREWKKCDEKLREAIKTIDKLKQDNDNINAGWKECDKKYQDVLEGWKKSEEKYQEVLAGWNQCNQQLQMEIEEKNKIKE